MDTFHPFNTLIKIQLEYVLSQFIFVITWQSVWNGSYIHVKYMTWTKNIKKKSQYHNYTLPPSCGNFWHVRLVSAIRKCLCSLLFLQNTLDLRGSSIVPGCFNLGLYSASSLQISAFLNCLMIASVLSHCIGH